MKYYHAVALAYRLRSYPGSVDLFTSDDAHGYGWYWRHLARDGVSFHRVPGQHHEILSEQNVPVLAKSLAVVLLHKQANERAACSAGAQTRPNLAL